MRTIIQDSDDEGDVGSPIEIDEPATWPDVATRPEPHAALFYREAVSMNEGGDAGNYNPAEGQPHQSGQNFDALHAFEQDVWNLPPTMQQEFNRHQPHMFSEGSSTIPDPTIEQRQYLLEFLEPALDQIDHEPTMQQAEDKPSSSSLNWTQLIKSQSVDGLEPTAAHRTEQAPPQAWKSCQNALQDAVELVIPDDITESLGMVQESATHFLTEAQSLLEDFDNESKEPAEKQKEAKFIRDMILPPSSQLLSRKRKSSRQSEDEGYADELAGDISNASMFPESTRRTKKPKRKASQDNSIPKDELVLESPKLVANQTKRKRGRPRKSAIDTQIPVRNPTSLQQLECQAPQVSESTERSPDEVKHDGHDIGSIMAITQPVTDIKASARKSELTPTGDSATANDMQVLVAVEVPTTSKAIDPDDQNEQFDSKTETSKMSPPTKKRGRGRPKKSDNSHSIDVLEENHDLTTSVQTKMGFDKDGKLEALRELAVNGAGLNGEEAAEQPKQLSEDLTEHSNDDGRNEAKQAAPPKATDRLAGSRSSPLSKAKVSHRVGLSRRARIPSLLRVAGRK